MEKELVVNGWQILYYVSLILLFGLYFGFFLRDLFEKKSKPDSKSEDDYLDDQKRYTLSGQFYGEDTSIGDTDFVGIMNQNNLEFTCFDAFCHKNKY